MNLESFTVTLNCFLLHQLSKDKLLDNRFSLDQYYNRNSMAIYETLMAMKLAPNFTRGNILYAYAKKINLHVCNTFCLSSKLKLLN
jgi:hypothetical protein